MRPNRSIPRSPSLRSSLLRHLLPALLLPLVLFTAACEGEREVEAPPPGTPKLVVLVVSDQFRADYLDRARPLFAGGLARLAEEGVVFTQAHHGHAVTNTAPGQATLATGSHPARHGIVGNGWVERPTGEETYCVEDPRFGTSPANLRVPAFGDWLKERYPQAKVVSASGKDRGAVPSAGRDADAVFWYDREEGGWKTSGYYADSPPDWVETYNAAGPPVDLFYSGWEALPAVDPAAAAAAGFRPMDRGPFERGFPHVVGNLGGEKDEAYWGGLYRTPAVDEWLGDFGRELVKRHELGSDEWPDLLALSFSALDTVGHGYGPNSMEVLDTLLRLDRTLGELFDFLDQRLGREAYVVAFSGDHGVVPLPEVVENPELRAGLDEVRCLRQVVSEMEVTWGDDLWLAEPWYLDHGLLEEAGHDPAVVAADLAQKLEACPHVETAWTRAEILDVGDPGVPVPGGDFALRYRNGFDPDRSPDVMLQWVENFLPDLSGRTGHGSPYTYDTHVPFVLLGADLAPGEVHDPVLTTDVAPTLAALLDVTPPQEIDGVDRLSMARDAAPRSRPVAPVPVEGEGEPVVEGEAATVG